MDFREQPLDLSVIVVNYNGKAVLPCCLDSLVRERTTFEFEVVVVDNGSMDGSGFDLESQYPDFRFIRSETNLGFAAGCNLGLAQANPDSKNYMLLNPDTEVLPGALTELVTALNTHPNWGMVGPRMTDGLDRLYPAARRFPRPFDVFCECTRLIYCFPHSRLFAHYFYGDCKIDQLNEVDQIEGSALAIKGSVRREVGDLDERFFLFWEEVDWCRRVKSQGYEIHVVQSSVVRHFRASAMSQSYIFSRKSNAESAQKYFFKHHGDKGLSSLRRWMIAGLWIREIGSRILWVITKDRMARLRAEGARAEREVYRCERKPCP